MIKYPKTLNIYHRDKSSSQLLVDNLTSPAVGLTTKWVCKNCGEYFDEPALEDVYCCPVCPDPLCGSHNIALTDVVRLKEVRI
jgi:rubrerythrin